MDNTFWAFVSLVIFIAIIVYYRVPSMMTRSLDKRSDDIRKELDEARRLREEAQQVLAEYQRKRREAEEEAAEIRKTAERDAAAFLEEAKKRTEESVARRQEMAEQRIRQAEIDATNEVRASAVDVAVAAARRMLADEAKGETANRLFDESLETVRHRMN
ncbi:F0F1 ATP synthase subunit B [Pararhizobium mangrovi]|uniref:ATP synthase subunit b n=1 Tax=Pararhizobium mangrovi TaxID=2590452 RepID=A0A506TY77_9HYPH|nr:F0F1 ATP synthase subunit B [Pararhizobium mangrovi]TPW25921.1 F0F1 ATP synthase subunit B [Pararhizobium mangrovi]